MGVYIPGRRLNDLALTISLYSSTVAAVSPLNEMESI
jgi:hypothetical protein